ncbi:MAG: hypothetical protein ACYDGM_10740 [Vulcanimicrobiaceae bacterium]
MIARRSIIAASVALALTACQGGFGGTSTPGGVNPPVNQPPAGALGPATAAPRPSPSGSPGIPPGSTASYDFKKAPAGFQCPQVDGFTCFIRLNMPIPSPSPSTAATNPGSSATPSPTPSPTPTPTPSPTPSPAPSGSGMPSAMPSPSPSPGGPRITLALDAMPKDAPKMVNPDPKAVATEALLAVRLHADADVALHGLASADFTLPKAQIGGRGFAIQVFHEAIGHHKKITETFLGSYAKSTLKGTTLHFALALPQITVKKDEVWLFVLYGDDRPSASGSPSAAPSASPSASSAPSSTPAPSTSPVPSPT